MLDTCTSEQRPFAVGVPYSLGNYLYPGDSPAEACRNFAVGYSGVFAGVTEFQCVVSFGGSSSISPVVRVCEPVASSPFSMSVQDGAALSMLIISVWVSAAIFKWLARVVSDKGDKDD